MFGSIAGFEEIELDQVLRDAGRILADDVEKRIDHLRLQLRRDAADHAEIEKCEPTVVHHEQIAGMRIGVKKAVFEQLLQIGFDQQPVDLSRRKIVGCLMLEFRSPWCRE